MVALAAPASAAVLNCGDTVTTNTTLSNDVGPCTGNGLVIGANDVTLNLGGHTVTGSNTTNTTRTEQVGVLIQGHRNVVVQNGTVTGFDAGVAITKGSKNQVINVTAHDNINHSHLVNAPGAATNKCAFGDGIVVTGSNNNIIKNNTAFHNGPFDGIALVGNSDNNIVSGNKVFNQTVSNELAGVAAPNNNGPCGPFGANGAGAGRRDQDIGIRIEGPGADNNQVIANSSTDNMLDGITIHGYVCFAGNGGVSPPGAPPVAQPNTGNLIQANNSRRNGFDLGTTQDSSQPPYVVSPGTIQDGIAILRQGPFGNVTCASDHNSIIGNTSVGNARNGIFVPPTGNPATVAGNTVNQNIVNDNGVNGIIVQGPFTICPFGQGNSTPPNFCNVPRVPRDGSNDNTLISNKGQGNGSAAVAPTIGADGVDLNPKCDHNFWKQNIFGTVNQPCVAANFGTGTVVGPIP